MKIECTRLELHLAHRWAVSQNAARGGVGTVSTVVVELSDGDGIVGVGEAPTTTRYAQDAGKILTFLSRIDPAQLSFSELERSLQYVRGLPSGLGSAKCAVETALLDGACRRKRQTLRDHFALGFSEGRHFTSFSIGIDLPERIRLKVTEAARYPILKLKVGHPDDSQNLAALREAAPGKRVRVDANEAWVNREEALRRIEKLAGDPGIEFVEQPMPANSRREDLAWLKVNSPLPIYADESYQGAPDASFCTDCFHGVNVKLIKTGGPVGAYEALMAARAAGLKTMLGCMIETSICITAAAHLAELADHLDLDGNLLIANDPYTGVKSSDGCLSFTGLENQAGLQVGRAIV